MATRPSRAAALKASAAISAQALPSSSRQHLLDPSEHLLDHDSLDDLLDADVPVVHNSSDSEDNSSDSDDEMERAKKTKQQQQKQKKGKQALSPPTPKAAAAATTSPPAGAGNANVNNMYEVCRTGPSTHVTATAKALVQSALTNERGAVSKLITLTMRAAGINAVDAAVAPAELDKPNAMDALVDAKAQVARDTELDAESAKDKRTLARGVHSMWQQVGAAACESDAALRGNLLQTLSDFAVKLSACSVRDLRTYGAEIALALITSLVSTAANTQKVLVSTQRQLEAAQGTGQRANKGKAATLKHLLETTQSKHERLHDRISSVFQGAFTHRFRDVDVTVRKACIESLGSWVAMYPTHFLDDSFLKYVGWAMNDPDQHVRRSALAALKPLYAPKKGSSMQIQAMDLFTQRFAPRVLKMTSDVDQGVRVAAIALVRTMLISDAAEDGTFFLAEKKAADNEAGASPSTQPAEPRDRMLETIRSLLITCHAEAVRKAAGDLLVDVYLAFAEPVSVAKGRAKGRDSAMLGALAQLASFIGNDASSEEVDSIVDAVAEKAPVLQDWDLLVECMTCDEAAAALSSAADLEDVSASTSPASSKKKASKKARSSSSSSSSVALRRAIMRLLASSVTRMAKLARDSDATSGSRKRDAEKHGDAHKEATRALSLHAPALLRLFGPSGAASDDASLTAAVKVFAALKLEVYSVRRAEASYSEALNLVREAALAPAPASPDQPESWMAAFGCFAFLADAEMNGTIPPTLRDAIANETSALAEELTTAAVEASERISSTLASASAAAAAPSRGGGKRGRGGGAAQVDAEDLLDVDSSAFTSILQPMQRLQAFLYATGGVAICNEASLWEEDARAANLFDAIHSACNAMATDGKSVHGSIEQSAVVNLYMLSMTCAYCEGARLNDRVAAAAASAEAAIQSTSSEKTDSDADDAILRTNALTVVCDLANAFAPGVHSNAAYMPSEAAGRSLHSACETSVARLADPDASAAQAEVDDSFIVNGLSKLVANGRLYGTYPYVTHMLFATLFRQDGVPRSVRDIAKVVWDTCRKEHRSEVFVPSLSGVAELLYEHTVLPLLTSPSDRAALAWECKEAEDGEEDVDERLQRRLDEFKQSCTKLHASIGLPNQPGTTEAALAVLRRGLSYLTGGGTNKLQQMLRLRFAYGLSALVAKIPKDALAFAWPTLSTSVATLRTRAEGLRDDASLLKELKEELPKAMRADAAIGLSEAVSMANTFVNILAERAGEMTTAVAANDDIEEGDDAAMEEELEEDQQMEEEEEEEDEEPPQQQAPLPLRARRRR